MKKGFNFFLILLSLAITQFSSQCVFPAKAIGQSTTFNEINLNPAFSGSWEAKLKIRNQLPLSIYCGPNCKYYCPEEIQDPKTIDCSCLCGAAKSYLCQCINNKVSCHSFCKTSCPKHFYKSCVVEEVRSEEQPEEQFYESEDAWRLYEQVDPFISTSTNTQINPKCCIDTKDGAYCPEQVSCLSKNTVTFNPIKPNERTISLSLCVQDGKISGYLSDNSRQNFLPVVSQTIFSSDNVILIFRLTNGELVSVNLVLLDRKLLQVQFDSRDSFRANKVLNNRFCGGTDNAVEVFED